MIDFFIGRSPTQNWNAEDPPLPSPKTVRELLQIARNARLERRKTTSDRRRRVDDDFTPFPVTLLFRIAEYLNKRRILGEKFLVILPEIL